MRLSDIMSQMGLASYAEVGLILFFLVFVAVGIRLWRTSHETLIQQAHIPLNDPPNQK